MASAELQPGDHVYWKFGVGQARGQVVEKFTEHKKIGSRTFKASPEEPMYVVKSEASGKEAVRKPETLHKIEEGGTDVQGKPKADASRRGKRTAASENTHLQGNGTGEAEVQDPGDNPAKQVAANKVPDIGLGSVRATTKAVKKAEEGDTGRPDADADLLDDEGEKDGTYDPQKDAANDDEVAPADEAAITSLPSDEELHNVLKEEGRSAGSKGSEPKKGALARAAKGPVGKVEFARSSASREAPAKETKNAQTEEGLEGEVDEDLLHEEGEEEDATYDPQKDPQEDVEDAVADELAIDELPPDEELLKKEEGQKAEPVSEKQGIESEQVVDPVLLQGRDRPYDAQQDADGTGAVRKGAAGMNSVLLDSQIE